jgi:TRAP-type C4-dicarboxylate transport system permease small subunit
LSTPPNRGFTRVLDAISAATRSLAVLLFALLTLVVALQVVTRFITHTPFIWSEEAARFLFFWVVLLGAASSVRARRHFVIDIGIPRDRLGRAGRFVLDVLPDVLILAFGVFLLVQGIGYTRIGLLRTATNSRVNMGFVYAAIPVFATLCILYTLANLRKAARGDARGHGLSGGRPGGPADDPASSDDGAARGDGSGKSRDVSIPAAGAE